MKLLKMSGHDCLLYSAAMVLDESPDILEREIGHDGSEVWWPDKPQPFCRRGLHIQEIQDCFFRRGKVLYPIDLMPASAPRGGEPRAIWNLQTCVTRFNAYLDGRLAILITATHAVAWNGKKVYDPNGRISSIDDYGIKQAWFCNQIISPENRV